MLSQPCVHPDGAQAIHIDYDGLVQQSTIDALLPPAQRLTTGTSVDQGGSTMNNDVDQIADIAMQKLGDHMDDLDKHALTVVRRYAESLLAGRPGSPHAQELASPCDRLVRMCTEDAAEEYALRRRAA